MYSLFTPTPRTQHNVWSVIGSEECVLSRSKVIAWKCLAPTKWAVVVKDGARARDANFGDENTIINTSFSRFVAGAQNMTTTAHFVGSGRFQALIPSREHAFHAPHVRSDVRSRPWRR